ncbi:hypothetical protein [Variovorax sp. JS1663]|uniref:hypothetical protein n=1 Tax=Variovorax sp. JS1663 TaxID=1851577 RepID=UPI00117F23B3|nr:hypothetical protein [Variovorax sp. JS1663]
MTSSTKVLWRVQVRKSRAHKWVNKGLYETRDAARAQAHYLRTGRVRGGEVLWDTAYGFGNTRVVRYEKGAK